MLKWCDRTMIQCGHVALCLSEESFRKHVKKRMPANKEHPIWLRDKAGACVHEFVDENHQAIYIVCMRYEPKQCPVTVCGMLVHEAVHVWQKHARHIGEHDPSIEFEAYSIEAIFTHLLNAYSELTKKGKK